MLRLDRRTHRYMIEPLSGMQHLKKNIYKAFMSFSRKLEASPKASVREVYAAVKDDCRSVTGANLRRISIECAVDPSRPFSEISIEKTQFFPIPSDAEWKISLAQELMEMRDDNDGTIWDKEEIDETLQYLCTSWRIDNVFMIKSFIWFERNNNKKSVYVKLMVPDFTVEDTMKI